MPEWTDEKVKGKESALGRGTSGPKKRILRTAQAAATSAHGAGQHQNEVRI